MFVTKDRKGYDNNSSIQPKPDDFDKVKSVLRQLKRDWSTQGLPERLATYNPIIEKIQDIYKNLTIEEKAKISILVPGAGLGRLPYEIVKLGYSCEGNEFSFHMLLASSQILNHSKTSNQFIIYPFITQFSNWKSAQDQLEPFYIPDELPNLSKSLGNLSIVAGDFLNIEYKNHFDGIITCFFLDTAKNILDYIDKIFQLLNNNGWWINFGPLLYHFENNPESISIELTLNELKKIIIAKKFDILEEKFIFTPYTNSPKLLLQYNYECCFWFIKKK